MAQPGQAEQRKVAQMKKGPRIKSAALFFYNFLF
jgi:hypothetical protein